MSELWFRHNKAYQITDEERRKAEASPSSALAEPPEDDEEIHDEGRCEFCNAAKASSALAEALEPFAMVAEQDIGDDEADTDIFLSMNKHNRAPLLTVGDLRRARAALSARPEPVQKLPAGYVLVPIEPTEAMLRAGDKSGYWTQPGPHEITNSSIDVYRAMLAASPSPIPPK